MRILVEALGISKFGGGRSATLPLFEALLPLASGDEFIFLLEDFEPTLDYPHVRQIIVPIRNRFKARIWLQSKLPGLVKREAVDLVHFAKNLTVLGLKVKTIVTLYDLTLLQFPAGFSKIDVWYWKFLQPLMLRSVTKIQAISENTANELKTFYHLPDQKIRVIYPSCHPNFQQLDDGRTKQIRDCYGLPRQVIMHVGSFGPKKNIDTLIKAFASMTDAFDGKLVFVGGAYRPGYDLPVKRLIHQYELEQKVIFTGIVPLKDLPGLMNAATVVVYPSLHEGFGIVAVETMACGTPLIVSPGGALREVVGDGALVVKDPCNADELALALQRLCHDETLRNRLRQRCLTRSKAFAPATIANQTLEFYRDVIGGDRELMKLETEKKGRDQVIASYDHHYSAAGILRESNSFYLWILKKLGVQPKSRLLDVASGEGYMVQLAARQGLQAIGVDFSKQAARIANRHAGAIVTVGDGESLPFGGASFDYVTNIGSLEHFFDPKSGLQEMRRVLRPHGKAALFLPNSFYLIDIIWHVWRTGYGVSHKQMIERFATKNEWRDLIESEGFRVLSLHKYNFAFPTTSADFAWYRQHPRKILYLLLAPFIPTNLSYSFLYIAELA